MKHRKAARSLALLLSIVLALGCLSGTAFAAGSQINVKVPFGVDSVSIRFDEDSGYPFIDANNRTLVPMRAVGEALGLSVEWDGKTNSALFMELMLGAIPVKTVAFPVGSSTYTVTTMEGTQTKEMDTAVVLKNGRTYAPIRYLAEEFGYTVEWDGDSRTVTVGNGWDEETTANMAMFFDAMEEAKYIINRPHAYEAESFNAYYDLFELNYWTVLSSRTPLTQENMWQLYALLEAREKLVQTVDDPEDTIWYIWGDEVPGAAATVGRDYSYAFDRSDFKPFIVPYLLKDQSQVKGNIVVIAGGGYALRSNSYEGYAVAERFNELGYNTFVLQRRVVPATPTDAFLDLQRAIRYIRYHAQEYSIAKTDKIACCGFSGGAHTINGTVSDFYGNVLPTAVYPDYVCDEIDKVNSDMQSALLIYGAAALDTENPNLPDVFMAIGSADATVDPMDHVKAIEYYASQGVRYEAHFFAGMDHGFGGEWGFNSNTFTNYESPVTSVWPEMADTFLSVQWGYLEQFTEHER